MTRFVRDRPKFRPTEEIHFPPRVSLSNLSNLERTRIQDEIPGALSSKIPKQRFFFCDRSHREKEKNRNKNRNGMKAMETNDETFDASGAPEKLSTVVGMCVHLGKWPRTLARTSV